MSTQHLAKLRAIQPRIGAATTQEYKSGHMDGLLAAENVVADAEIEILHLKAARDDLLKALQDLLWAINLEHPESHEAVDVAEHNARAAIAKVTGEQQ